MKKQDKYYLIIICENGRTTVHRCETESEKTQWLFDYFTIGDEKWFAYALFEQSIEKEFSKFVKKFIKPINKSDLQTFNIRKGKQIIIQAKNKEKVGK